MNGVRLSWTTFPSGSAWPNSRSAMISLTTTTREPLVSSPGVKVRPWTMSPPFTSSQLAVKAEMRALESSWS